MGIFSVCKSTFNSIALMCAKIVVLLHETIINSDTIVLYNLSIFQLKQIVHPKMKILSVISHNHVVPTS